MYHVLEPEVSGGLGDNTVMDNSSHPPQVSKLHYQLDGWLGDELLESFPCYIVSSRLHDVIAASNATGCSFDDVEVTTSEQFREMYPDRDVPTFVWLKVTGAAGKDDFGVSADNCLVVSDRVFQLMKLNSQLDNCDVEAMA